MNYCFLTTAFIFCFIIGASAQSKKFELSDFYTYDANLAFQVDSIYNELSNRERIAQMIITSAGKLGKSNKIVQHLVKTKSIGGVVFLKGSKAQHIKNIKNLNQISKHSHGLPLLYSMDAEPSLLSGRIQGAKPIRKTMDIKTAEQSETVVNTINEELQEIGIHQNYAPVLDVSANNEAIKHRSYGSDKKKVIALAKHFVETTQKGGIIATAKHFPGHGLVQGDTHKQSVFINGELQEADNYKPLISAGVLAIMVAHITVHNNQKYDTQGLPASCSKTIVTDLLKNELQFKGIIISDALNIMKAVTIQENAPLQVSKAGCDLILMPQDEEHTIQTIATALEKDPAYAKQVQQSVKKILRLKICAGLF